ncbi:UpxY family transcription antiterminator [Aureibaculum luteum]|uniref:UpxY family transcription antiterminator n=1 Tax=Aureibaculum luteum TaxID=1548456 RepID=UPI000E47F233|nr:UpxY family transcription antiterminator [Aureibaculum luteum]
MPITNQQSKWYAIYTRANSEKKVYEQLCRSGYVAYLPLITTYRQWSDRKKKVQSPLISSYVFVKIEEKKLTNVLSISGALRILKYLGRNAVVKDEEIKSLKLLLNYTPEAGFSMKQHLSKGDVVEVIKGSLIGLKGYYTREKNQNKIYIKIRALNSYFGAEIPLNYVKKVSSIKNLIK